MRLRVLAAMATSMVATSSFAQDRMWRGGYAGISAGLDFAHEEREAPLQRDTDLDGIFADTGRTTFAAMACSGRTASAPVGCRRDSERSGYGGHVGYDLQFGDVVVGAVGEFGRSNIGERNAGNDRAALRQRIVRSMDWSTQGRLRAGYALGDTLPYVTGGAAMARIDRGPATDRAGDHDRSNGWGWTAGAGLDQRVSERFSIGLLYTFTSVTDRSRSAGERLPLADVTPGDRRFDWHSARVRANFRF
ncbi:outer membrane beta-barrel protein [Sphingomonas sp. 2R-10]|nr:outer membrane beta-barrel protein [Sphingomonas sp. 2R-10]